MAQSSPDFYALQTALYDRLKASPDLVPLVNGIYDYVPEDTSYPYVTFDTLTATRETALDLSSRLVVEQAIRAYSNDADVQKGWEQVRSIATTLYALFDAVAFFVNGRRVQSFVGRMSIARETGTVRVAVLAVQIYFV
jgi:hypothetical protein